MKVRCIKCAALSRAQVLLNRARPCRNIKQLNGLASYARFQKVGVKCCSIW